MKLPENVFTALNVLTPRQLAQAIELANDLRWARIRDELNSYLRNEHGVNLVQVLSNGYKAEGQITVEDDGPCELIWEDIPRQRRVA